MKSFIFKMKTALFISFFILSIVTQAAVSDTINYTDKTGKRQGKWVITNKQLSKPKPDYQPDQKIEEGKYVDGKKTGKWIEYYSNGKIKTVITYVNNKPIGYAILYHENGKIKEEGMWNIDRWVGEYKLYYENGEVQQSFNFNAMGKREGLQQYFYDNGQIMIEGTWSAGKEAGTLKEYYVNGDIKAEKYFNGGNIDTVKTKYYAPKKPVATTKTGKTPVVKTKNSDVVAATANPQTEKSFTENFNGNGPHKLYNSNKQLSKDGVFQNYKLIDGKVYHYNKDGLLTRIALYKDAKYIGDANTED